MTDGREAATRSEAAQARAGRGGLLALGAGLGLVGSTAITFGFSSFLATIDRVERPPARSADAIVALTGGAQRVSDAVDLLAQGYGRRLLITGVNERTTRAEIAALNPKERALVDCCVDLDYRARNTVGNASETGRWTRRNGFRSLVVVTSNYHMARTLAEFDHVMPEVAKVPRAVVSGSVDVDGWWTRVGTARLLVGEYVKYLGSRLRVRLVGPRSLGDPPQADLLLTVRHGGAP